MKTLLVTGGCGFIGSNFLCHILKAYPDYEVVNIDKLTYAGSLSNVKAIQNNPRYHFIEGDICDMDILSTIFSRHTITHIVHFAAESHVDNSIASPMDFIHTNINGTFALLDMAKKKWIDATTKYDIDTKDCVFLHVSTDEVYGELGEEGYFTEETPYAPNSPYSASKASSDMLVRAYHKTYGLQTLITNCSNNYGPNQHDEKLIPTIIRKAIRGEHIPIYGNGKNVRDWLYVEDHCRAIDTILHKGKYGEVYNIGSSNEWANINIAKKICCLLDEMKPSKDVKSYVEYISFVQDRLGHDKRYAIDSNKITSELGWMPKQSFEEGLRCTIAFYLNIYISY